MEQIKIGRRIVNYNDFVKAVANSERYTEVCVLLGFNETVPTTRQAVKDKIEELQLDTTHFTYKYTKSEIFEESAKTRIKHHNIYPVNQVYYDCIEKKFEDKPQSFCTYKVDCGGILEELENRDFATITVNEVINYAGEKKSALNHIRSMMIQSVKENVNNCIDKVNKEMLVWLIG